MKTSILFAPAVLFCLASATASAASKDAKSGDNRIVPVLVTVNPQGKVTDAKPAYKLRPSFVQVIHDTVSKMITKPATNHGKPVTCQFVINLAMTTIPKQNGTYGVTFKYLSSKALPVGAWYWVRTGDHRLALRDQQSNGEMNFADVRAGMQVSDANPHMAVNTK